MKLLLLIFIILVVAVAGGGDGDENNNVAPLPPVGAHDANHDCTWEAADAILRNQAGLGYAVPDGCRVTWTDGTYIMVCQGGVPSTLFQPVSADTARDMLQWPAESLVLIVIIGVFVLLGLGGGSRERTA
jgi:hypothetical protein